METPLRPLPPEDALTVNLTGWTLDGIPHYEVDLLNVERVDWIPNEGILVVVHQEGESTAVTTIRIPTHIRGPIH